MTETRVALLRGINVGGHRKVKMADLREALSGLGVQARTYLQSGNVVARTDLDAQAFARVIREAILIAGGPDDVPVLTLTADQLHEVVDGQPFTDAEPSELHVTFQAAIQMEGSVEHPAPDSRDEFVIHQPYIYVRCPDGYGRTKLTNTFFEKALQVDTTTRNWRTVTALLAMAAEA